MEMEENYSEIIHTVCGRPMMFAHDGKFQTIADFLSGYDWAKRDTEGKSELKDRFRDWLAQRFYKLNGTPRNYVWWAYISIHFPKDEEAFNQLPLLYQEYRDSINSGV